MFATIARYSAKHRRWVSSAWLVLFVVGLAAGFLLFGRLKDSAGGQSSDSTRGVSILNKATSMGPNAVVVVQGPPVSDSTTRLAVQALTTRITALPNVAGALNTYDTPDPALRAPDGHASLIVVMLRKDADMTARNMTIGQLRSTAHGSVPGARVQVGGDAAMMRDGMNAGTSDLYRGDAIAFPVLLVALFFIFGGLRAALVPIVASLVASSATLLVLLGISHLTSLAPYAMDVVMLLGLGLAVDYSLLMVNRFREARAAGADLLEAIEHTGASAGRTVMFSAATVATSLAGLFVFGDPTFSSVAWSGIATTLVAAGAAITLIPALLGSWGGKIKPAQRQDAEHGVFGRLARQVQRRPWLAAVGITVALLAAAVPFLHANYGNGDPRTLPAGTESRLAAQTLLAEFPRMQSDPIQIVAPVAASDPRVSAYAAVLQTRPGVAAVIVEQGLHGAVSAIDVTPAGPAQGTIAKHLVTSIRADRPGYRTYVTGQEASLIDFEHGIAHRAPYALAFIALAIFVLLFLMTGSVLVPLKALVMNTLSLGATFGALVWVFQDGHLSGLLGFTPFGAIEAWLPVIVFVFAFGLSMDYEVFLLSRIKEAYDESGDSNDAVADGLQRSGRIITSAALLVMIVFLGFAAGHSLGIKEMGVALALAVAVDATLVRCILVPATMTLLGRANWWAPAPLRKLHNRFGLRELPSRPAGRTPTVTAAAGSTAEADGLEVDGVMTAA